KEIRRFMAVYKQTILAPVVTTLLFLVIFSLALGGSVRSINGMAFQVFLAPGLIIMVIAQNAFTNTSSSLVISKIEGTIVDVLMSPLNAFEMIFAYLMGAIVRGFLVGIATFIGIIIFMDLPLANIGAIFIFGFLGAMMLGLLGVLGGVWADKFDHISAVTNFVITPFSFLSGTFYTISRVPEPFQSMAWFNPFFYMIDGFRYGFLGRSDADPLWGAILLGMVNAALAITVWRLISRGYKLKA
ncbi:MAG: ABC transporter permease, partial [Pseudomonadota bacterium]